jgi:hypothetical protein
MQTGTHNTGTTVSVTNGSATVTGNGTEWTQLVQSGDGFTVKSDGVLYDVASVTSDTELQLSAPYQGTTNASAQYTIHRDFTVDGFPELNSGDVETATIMKRFARKVQEKFNNL